MKAIYFTLSQNLYNRKIKFFQDLHRIASTENLPEYVNYLNVQKDIIDLNVAGYDYVIHFDGYAEDNQGCFILNLIQTPKTYNPSKHAFEVVNEEVIPIGKIRVYNNHVNDAYYIRYENLILENGTLELDQFISEISYALKKPFQQ